MLRTPLLDLLGIQHPIIQAGMGRFGSGAELVAAVSNAGAIGTLGCAKRPLDELEAELDRLRDLTDRPFIVNFTAPWLRVHPECLDRALAARPRAISFSLGLPPDAVARTHAAGALAIAQVQTVEAAREVADAGIDVVIAQGTEAGGFGARVGVSVLVPQVVDAVAPLPVVAAGGIADGRGLAAVLVLGATGANIGTRFLAAEEAAMNDAWKRGLVSGSGSLATDGLLLVAAGDGHGVGGPDIPRLGQAAGTIRSIEPAATIVRRLVEGAEEALARTGALVVGGVPS